MSDYYQGDAISRETDAVGFGSRADFVVRTYLHLFAAVAAFVGLEVYLFQSGLAETIARQLLGVSWMLVLGAFMVIGWGASRVAATSESMPAQYAALAAYVVAEAIIFVPLLYIANAYAPGAIRSAAIVTMTGFTGLTFVAWTSRKDFSFLGAFLKWGFVVALVAIFGGLLFGFELGTWFSVAMVGFAGAAILYDTSNVLLHFPEDRHVGAALQLFASVALMFWYILQLFSSRD